ncbi:MAG: FG-GAP-like repeat-containing protein, partial [Actinomycetota bacterium]
HDVDEDGDVDVMLGRTWLRNEPGDAWTPVDIFTPRTGESDRLRLADVDGDGDDDLVLGNGHDPAGEVSWYERPDDPTGQWTHHLIDNLNNPQSLDAADLDGDGDIDLVVGEHDRDRPDEMGIYVYENLGGGTGWRRVTVYVGDEHHDGAQFVDTDGDGDLDIVSIGFIQQRVVLYENRTGD